MPVGILASTAKAALTISVFTSDFPFCLPPSDLRASDFVLAIAVSGQTLYTVKSGDNLTRIASHNNVSLEALEEANKETVANPDRVFPGQQLVIPAA